MDWSGNRKTILIALVARLASKGLPQLALPESQSAGKSMRLTNLGPPHAHDGILLLLQRAATRGLK